MTDDTWSLKFDKNFKLSNSFLFLVLFRIQPTLGKVFLDRKKNFWNFKIGENVKPTEGYRIVDMTFTRIYN